MVELFLRKLIELVFLKLEKFVFKVGKLFLVILFFLWFGIFVIRLNIMVKYIYNIKGIINIV